MPSALLRASVCAPHVRADRYLQVIQRQLSARLRLISADVFFLLAVNMQHASMHYRKHTHPFVDTGFIIPESANDSLYLIFNNQHRCRSVKHYVRYYRELAKNIFLINIVNN